MRLRDDVAKGKTDTIRIWSLCEEKCHRLELGIFVKIFVTSVPAMTCLYLSVTHPLTALQPLKPPMGERNESERSQSYSFVHDTSQTLTRTHSHNFHLTEVKQLLESVGLDYARDGAKRPSELSGGMARRASLALQLAQKKRVIILDEPFTGLDEKAAQSVAKELVHLRVQYKTALLLISHEPLIAALVMDHTKTISDNQTVELQATNHNAVTHRQHHAPYWKGTTFLDRFTEKL